MKYMLHARFLTGWETYGQSPSVAREKKEPVSLLIVGREKIVDQKLIFVGLLQCNLFCFEARINAVAVHICLLLSLGYMLLKDEKKLKRKINSGVVKEHFGL